MTRLTPEPSVAPLIGLVVAGLLMGAVCGAVAAWWGLPIN